MHLKNISCLTESSLQPSQTAVG